MSNGNGGAHIIDPAAPPQIQPMVEMKWERRMADGVPDPNGEWVLMFRQLGLIIHDGQFKGFSGFSTWTEVGYSDPDEERAALQKSPDETTMGDVSESPRKIDDGY